MAHFGRAAIVRLKEAVSQLGYLASDTGARPLDYARGYVDEARRFASELKIRSGGKVVKVDTVPGRRGPGARAILGGCAWPGTC